MLIEFAVYLLTAVALGVLKHFAAIAKHERSLPMFAMYYASLGLVILLFGMFLLSEAWESGSSFRITLCFVILAFGGAALFRPMYFARRRMTRPTDA